MRGLRCETACFCPVSLIRSESCRYWPAGHLIAPAWGLAFNPARWRMHRLLGRLLVQYSIKSLAQWLARLCSCAIGAWGDRGEMKAGNREPGETCGVALPAAWRPSWQGVVPGRGRSDRQTHSPLTFVNLRTPPNGIGPNGRRLLPLIAHEPWIAAINVAIRCQGVAINGNCWCLTP